MCVGIVGELVGFARVLSDFIYKAVIFDVIVAPDERGKGLGITLMELIKHHPKLNKVLHFELYFFT
ncbi:GNAT family N-acetyltransferase [Pseudoalteromonas obscura]|uniref:GNAT family N-acetyltransferase n=1 Tax=Pseudoalteromonas obscura TaxID=3048491 RepID=UPI003A985ECE